MALIRQLPCHCLAAASGKAALAAVAAKTIKAMTRFHAQAASDVVSAGSDTWAANGVLISKLLVSTIKGLVEERS